MKTDFSNVSNPPKAFVETNFTQICAIKKTPVQAIGLYRKKNGLIVLL